MNRMVGALFGVLCMMLAMLEIRRGTVTKEKRKIYEGIVALCITTYAFYYLIR
ncbi:hypothetical protein [Fusobacterium necrophorum]|uniref:Uncharacterized protein n=2 Tax=Fusobacterium necrophorum TaxID=859 RepID=A0AAN4ATV2_9FUSO|nr:hypothetical protein [Fusobacterium necrophorum]EJU18829.1 hypothetical protein HMPREF1127_1055 [Fusobacterium necrophorum subsp. funduliforme Fnf 1007]MDK4474277.1 hypothetical protein [Fusobacterium necrophorum]MDK4481451.1 hypothetical protein [Fusobacterium necrophorum]MDK4482324.1 hypothetical protein [Fusobacterium necrophorum]MDK4494453.1 hypothetical protein [Fusobacterium necrophorum]